MYDVTKPLLIWFQHYGRSFSFRWQKDPYRILVAGVLLRQTQAVQVDSVFPLIIERYGTPQTLAHADEGDLRLILKPLGMTSRAKMLIDIARTIIIEHGGAVPSSYEDLVMLPGIGDYIASCVLSLGYEIHMPMVDSNVMRVIGRVFGVDIDAHALYSDICPKGKEEPFHYAILDLSQLVCRYSKPKCDVCPLSSICKSSNRSEATDLPPSRP